ncbi:hypothetical protein CKY51_11420 [Xanthomonas maliensis]|nr:hypothetical protein CKY51_11420 [Xanthomonas maliensis]
MFADPEAIAKAWLGHDASELMLQWPVDRGLYISENVQTQETAYTYNFGIPAHYRTDYWVEQGPMVGVVQGGGVATPIFSQELHSSKTFVPQEDHCEVTFVADAQGIISRYDFAGSKCKPYIRGWGRPKKR